MAIDVVHVCEISQTQSDTLFFLTTISVVFSLYIFFAVGLASIAILKTSKVEKN